MFGNKKVPFKTKCTIDTPCIGIVAKTVQVIAITTIGVNFAKGVNAFNAEGSFSVWAGLDFNKILSSKPWDAVSYRKTTVESILIEFSPS